MNEKEQTPKVISNMKLRDYGFTTIVAAAILSGDYVFLGNTHAECLLLLNDNKAKIRYSDFYLEDESTDIKNGYITSNGEFVDSDTALEIADIAGQIDENIQSFTHYSENFFELCGKEFDIPYAKEKIREHYKLELIRNKERLIELISGDKSYEEIRTMKNDYIFGFLNKRDKKCSARLLNFTLEEKISEILSR